MNSNSPAQFGNNVASGRRGGRGRGRRGRASAVSTPANAGQRKPEVREQGIVAGVKDSFGFIACANRAEQLFFHVSEYCTEDDHVRPDVVDLMSELKPGDEVEFTVGPSPNNDGRENAKRVRKLPAGTIVREQVEAEGLKGEVRMGGGKVAGSKQIVYSSVDADGKAVEQAIAFSKHDVDGGVKLLDGDEVEFNRVFDVFKKQHRAAQIKRVSQGSATLQRCGPQMIGVIIKLTESEGVVRCVHQDMELPFALTTLQGVQPSEHAQLLNSFVSFGVETDDTGQSSVSNITLLKPFEAKPHAAVMQLQGSHRGVVQQPCSTDLQQRGVITISDGDFAGQSCYYSLHLVSSVLLLPDVGDMVQFQLLQYDGEPQKCAMNVEVLQRNGDTFEQGQIHVLKSTFGFIKCCSRVADMFFHMSALHGVERSELAVGDDVEFVAKWDNDKQQLVANCVRKLEKGSVKFEVISDEVHEGVVVEPCSSVKGYRPQSCSGVVQFVAADGGKQNLLFSVNDLEQTKAMPGKGDMVTFRILQDIKAAAVKSLLHGAAAEHCGRRATKVALRKFTGTVAALKPAFGFISFTHAGATARIFFHRSEVQGDDGVAVGDEVEFLHAINAQTKQPNARCVVKLRSSSPRMSPSPFSKPSTAANKSTSTSQGNSTTPMRMSKGPDGSKGFTMGRGRPLDHPPRALSRRLPSLNANAPEFLPRSLSSASIASLSTYLTAQESFLEPMASCRRSASNPGLTMLSGSNAASAKCDLE